MSSAQLGDRCACGDACTSHYDLHGWLCDECADAMGDDLYTDAEREMLLEDE
jgi:hypothetical protein